MKFNQERTASFDVDAQKCFTPLCPDELPVPDGEKIVHALNQQATQALLRLGSKDAHPQNALWHATEDNPPLSPAGLENIDLYWPAHALLGSYGYEQLDGLPPVNAYDFYVFKGCEPDMHPYGALYHDLKETISTGVIEFLTCKRITDVLVGGLALDYCVKTTALQLKKAGFNTYVNLAASRAVTEKTAHTACQEMKSAGIILLKSVSEASIEWLP